MAGNAFAALEDAAVVSDLVQKQHGFVRARFALSMGRLEDTASIRVIRRDIARLKTEIRRREIDAGLRSGELERLHAKGVKLEQGGSEAVGTGGLLAGAVDKLTQ
jgi:ribosomal protein L29